MQKQLTMGVILLTAATSFAAESAKTYKGEISDTQCALNVHSKTRSHNEMIEGGHMGKDPGTCARVCVNQMGGAYALVTKSAIYKLDDKDAVAPFAGKKVAIQGTLDEKQGLLHVQTIKASE